MISKLSAFLNRTIFAEKNSISEKIRFAIESELPTLLIGTSDFLGTRSNAMCNGIIGIYAEHQRITSEKLLKEMSKLSEKLDRACISFAFMKGPLLGRQIYDPAYLRATSDIDLFVSYDDLPTAMDVLAAAGYLSRFGTEYSGKDYAGDFHKGDTRLKIMGRHSACVNSTSDCTVELHAQLFRTSKVLSNEILRKISLKALSRTRMQECEGRLYPVLGHIDDFLMLCSHFSRHSVGNLTSLCKFPEVRSALSLSALHDLALYYEKYGGFLLADELLSNAEEFLCLSDLMFASRYLAEIYQLPFFETVYRGCLARKSADPEDVIHDTVSENFSAEELFSLDRAEVFARLKKLIPPAKTYTLQKLSDGNPLADCRVTESLDSPEDRRTTRDPIEYSWGGALCNGKLRLCISLPQKELFFRGTENNRKVSMTFRIYVSEPECRQDCGGCTRVYEICFSEKRERLCAALCDEHEKEISPCTVVSDSETVTVYADIPLINSDLPAWRFMISAYVSLPRPHAPDSDCTFDMRWVDSVAVTYHSCLCFGELRRPEA